MASSGALVEVSLLQNVLPEICVQADRAVVCRPRVTRFPHRGGVNPGSLLCPLPPVSAFWHTAICHDKARPKYPNTSKQTSGSSFLKKNSSKLGCMTVI